MESTTINTGAVYSTTILRQLPKPVQWIWYVFGKDNNTEGGMDALMVCEIRFNVPWWRRLITRIFMGSVWVKAK